MRGGTTGGGETKGESDIGVGLRGGKKEGEKRGKWEGVYLQIILVAKKTKTHGRTPGEQKMGEKEKKWKPQQRDLTKRGKGLERG